MICFTGHPSSNKADLLSRRVAVAFTDATIPSQFAGGPGRSRFVRWSAVRGHLRRVLPSLGDGAMPEPDTRRYASVDRRCRFCDADANSSVPIRRHEANTAITISLSVPTKTNSKVINQFGED
jgi:hypothetical protein